MAVQEQEREGKVRRRVKREYLTARVREGLTDEVRAAVPPGFQFGWAVEIALTGWLRMPEEERLKSLTGNWEEQLKEFHAAMTLWRTLPVEYREKLIQDQGGPSLVALVEDIVDRKISLGKEAARQILTPPLQKPDGGDSPDRTDDNSKR